MTSRVVAAVSLVTAIALAACGAPAVRSEVPPAPSPTAASGASSAPLPSSPAPSPLHEATSASRGGAMTVRFLDVGQGDSALITTSDHHAMLVDAGPESGATAVDAALASLDSAGLDLLVLSHAHADHLGELARITRTLPIGTFVDPGFDRVKFHPYAETLTHLRERNISHRAARKGDHMTLGAFVDLDVLAPEEPFLHDTRSDINSNSVILRLTHHGERGDVRVLFEGDAEAPTEQRLLADRASLRADVLKVAHHGSRYASGDALLDAVAPRLAVISCARGNDFGHPHAPTLSRLSHHHVTVARTDVEGTVTVTSDARGLTWSTTRDADAAALATPGVGRHAEAAP